MWGVPKTPEAISVATHVLSACWDEHHSTPALHYKETQGKEPVYFPEDPLVPWRLGKQGYSTHLGGHLLHSAAESTSRGGGHFLSADYWASWWSDHLSSGNVRPCDYPPVVV